MIVRRALAAMVLLTACGSKPGTRPPSALRRAYGNGADSASASSGARSGHSEALAAELAGWESWARKTAARFPSRGHGKIWVEIYTDQIASKPFDADTGPYPVGARLVKAQYEEQLGGAPKILTVMKKMAAGYDPDHGDWYYGVYGPDLAPLKEGRLQMCINCHTQVAELDYVFGHVK
jgi:hypothetical protein